MAISEREAEIYDSILEHDKNEIKLDFLSDDSVHISSIKSIMLLLPRNENMRKYAFS
jgi:hypothetical protein